MNQEIKIVQKNENFRHYEIKNNVVRHIFLEQSVLAFFFIKKLDFDDQKLLLESLLISEPAQNINSLFSFHNWRVNCFMNILNISHNFDPYPLYFFLLESSKAPYLGSILEILTENECDSKSLLKKLDSLILFARDNNRLFEAMRGKFDRLLRLATEESLFEQYNISSIPLLKSAYINSINISKIQIVPPEIFYSYSESFENTQFAVNYQNYQISLTIFPEFKCFEGSNRYSSLVNTSVLSKKPFVDIGYKTALNFFMIGEIQKGLAVLDMFQEMNQWLLILIIAQRLFDHSFLNSIFNIINPQILGNSICADFFHRILNNMKFMKQANKFFNGKQISQNYIIRHSIPKLFIIFLKQCNMTPFAGLSKLPLFEISDKDRIIDCDFICSYFILALILQTIEKGDEDTLLENVQKIESNFLLLNDKKLQLNVITDVFSLFFVQKNGKYLTSLKICEKILSILSLFAANLNNSEINEYIQDGIMKVQLLKTKNGANDDLSNLLISKHDFIVDAMTHNNIDLLNCLSKKSPRFSHIANIYQNVKKYSESIQSSKYVPDKSNKNSFIINCEIGFSYEQEINAINFVVNYDDYDDYDNDNDIDNKDNTNYQLKTLANQRFCQHSRYNFLKCVKKCDSLKIAEFSHNLSNLSGNSWNNTPFAQMKAKRFLSFASYIDSLIPLLLEAEKGKKVHEVLSIIPQKIIPKFLNLNRDEEASKVAAVLKTTIPEYILSNNETFKDDPNVVKRFLKKEKVVYMTYKIFAQNKNPQSASSALKKYIRDTQKNANNASTIKKEEKSEDNPLLKKMKIILETSPLDVDLVIEYSYQINSDDFIAIFDEKLFQLDIDQLSSISEEFGCDSLLHEKIFTLKRIKNLGIKLSPPKNIFSDLISKERFKLAKIFVKHFQYKLNITTLLRKEVLNYIHSKKNPEIIMEICPHLRNEIISSLPSRYTNILPIVCPSNSADGLIPSDWIQGQDIVSTLRNNVQDLPNVLKYLKAHTEIDFDNEFIQILITKPMSFKKDSTLIVNERIKTVNRFIKHYHPVFRSPEKIFQPCAKLMLSFVNDTVVNDSASEMLALSQMRIIQNVISDINALLKYYKIISNFGHQFNDISLIVSSLYDFVCCMIYSKYSIKYNFQNFISKTVAEVFNKYCYFYDMPDLAVKIANAWHLKDYEGREDYALKCLILGKYERGLYYAPNRRRTTSSVSAEQSLRLSNKVTAIYSKLSIYEIEFVTSLAQNFDIEPFMGEFLSPEKLQYKVCQPVIVPTNTGRRPSFGISRTLSSPPNEKKGSSGPRVNFAPIPNSKPIKKFVPQILTIGNYQTPHFFLRIKAIVEQRLSTSLPKENTKMLRHFLKMNSKISDQVSYFVSCGCIEKAIKYIKMQTLEQTKWNLFFNHLIIKSYAFNFDVFLKTRLKTDDPGLKYFGSYLEKLLKFAMRSEMPHLQLETELILERSETAALTAINLATTTNVLKDSYVFLRCADTALYTEISGHRSIRKVPNRLTPQKIGQLKRDIELQLKFCQFCLGKGLSECSMNLFHSVYTTESMVVFLFKEMQFTLAVDIIHHCGLSTASIGMKLIDMLINEDEESVVIFVIGLSKGAQQQTFELILSAMLMRLFFVFGNEKLALYLISKCVSDQDFKCRLMIQFIRLEEAFQIAKEAKLTHLMPLIGHMAQIQNLGVVVNDVNRLLTRRKSLSFISK